jgi:hypothetical protein
LRKSRYLAKNQKARPLWPGFFVADAPTNHFVAVNFDDEIATQAVVLRSRSRRETAPPPVLSYCAGESIGPVAEEARKSWLRPRLYFVKWRGID